MKFNISKVYRKKRILNKSRLIKINKLVYFYPIKKNKYNLNFDLAVIMTYIMACRIAFAWITMAYTAARNIA